MRNHPEQTVFMNDVNKDMQNLEDLNEAVWRRRLTPAEQARLRRRLAIQPEAGANWEGEIALTRALNRLPSAPVSSNFTALVLQAARRAPVRAGWRQQLDLNSWLPAGWKARTALATAMLCLSFTTAREYQIVERQKAARELAIVGSLAALQPAEFESMKDFHTIRSMGRVQLADDELLQVLQ